MAEGVRIVAECDGLAAPWEGGARLYRFVEGTVLLLLRKDDPRFLKVAYDGQPLFVPRAACVEVEVTSNSELSGPVAQALQLEEDRPPAPPWEVRESVAAFTLSVLVPAMFVGLLIALVPLTNYTFLVPLMAWALAVVAVGLVARLMAGGRAALWGTALGVAITATLVLSCLAVLSEADL